jgi:hypothetical protein
MLESAGSRGVEMKYLPPYFVVWVDHVAEKSVS